MISRILNKLISNSDYPVKKEIYYYLLKNNLIDSKSKDVEILPLQTLPNATISFFLQILNVPKEHYHMFYGLNRNRRFKIFVLALPKTGTSSLAIIFNKFWSEHEYDSANTFKMIIDYKKKYITKKEFDKFINKRDAGSGYLEMDSSWTNRFYMNLLYKNVPEAKFIFLIRDCISWANSQVNYFVHPKVEALGAKYKINGLPFDLPKGSNKYKKDYLNNIKIYLPNLLKYWNDENLKILNFLKTIPKSRYIILRTSEINASTIKLASLAGVPVNSLNKNIHININKDKTNIFKNISRKSLINIISNNAADCMNYFFLTSKQSKFALENYVNRFYM